MEIVDILPYGPDGTVKQVGNTMAFFPGWSATFPGSLGLFVPWNKAGERVITLESPRGKPFRFLPESLNFSQWGPNEIYRKALYYLDMIYHKLDTHTEGVEDIGKIDLAGFSEAGPVVALAALMMAGGKHQDRLGRVVLVNTVGLDKIHMAKRIVGIGKSMLQAPPDDSENPLSAGYSAGAYIVRNPNRSFRELQDIQATDPFDIIKQLDEFGVEVTIIQAIDDKVLDSKQVIASAERLGVPVKTFTGGHLDLASAAPVVLEALREQKAA